MNHLMIDIETLDTANTAVVVQVGWCLFDAHNISKPTELFPDIQDQIDMGRTISASTLKWWMTNESIDEMTRQRVFDPVIYTSIEDVAVRLRTVVGSGVDHVWSHGPHFDIAILKDLLGDNIFHYRSPRDTRTMSLLAPNAVKPPAMTKHSAGDDAYAQAQWMQNCWKVAGYQG
ncbi:MAG: 3'-5' exoribonuclease [Gammaproteobacteria bacterium]|nr:MAG: 3'-5' exoribonuclease [Gammaproteobacteria bacterium]